MAHRQSPWTVRLPNRHIPIDTSLCGRSAQVRIYGFVATGFSIFSCVWVDLSEDKMLKPLVQQKSLPLGHLVQQQIMPLGHFMPEMGRVSTYSQRVTLERSPVVSVRPPGFLIHLMQWALGELHLIRILIYLVQTTVSMANKQNEADPKRKNKNPGAR